MKKNIIIRTQFIALHCWPNCNIEEVNFLKNLHRHTFNVEVKFSITSNDRELEFIKCRKLIDSFISDKLELLNDPNNFCLTKSLGSMSCEMICEEIISFCKEMRLPITYISIFEDNENGAEIILND